MAVKLQSTDQLVLVNGEARNSLEGSHGKHETLESAVLDTAAEQGDVSFRAQFQQRLRTSRLQERSQEAAGCKAARPAGHRSGRSLRAACRTRSAPDGLLSWWGAYLCGGINLGLPRVLSLSEHGCGADLGAVLAADEVGGLLERRGVSCRPANHPAA